MKNFKIETGAANMLGQEVRISPEAAKQLRITDPNDVYVVLSSIAGQTADEIKALAVAPTGSVFLLSKIQHVVVIVNEELPVHAYCSSLPDLNRFVISLQ